MASERPSKLVLPVDPKRDHILGGTDAGITLVEYGSYACRYCHAAHQVVANLRDRFGDRLRYVYRHLPLVDREQATHAAELVEYAGATSDRFWEVHDALMRRSHSFNDGDLEEVAREFELPPVDERDEEVERAAGIRVRDDARSGIRSGARVTPTFFINGTRYDGAWDETALSEALFETLGHKLHAASLNFARWAPGTGLLLLLMSVLAVVLSNTAIGPAFDAFWHTTTGLQFGGGGYALPLIDWVNHGLLSVFFLVVGLEIKRELTVGRLANRRAAAFPIAAALGGMIAPALIYFLLMRGGPLQHGWGLTIATDTAFAVALIVLLGDRVPVDLRVFLTAAVIVDDLVAIGVVALFYSEAIVISYIAAAVLVTAAMAMLNRWGVYRVLPYAVLGVVLWLCLHAAGLHATLAGVVLAILIPTRPPANVTALMAQAETVMQAEAKRAEEGFKGHGPSQHTLETIDRIHDRIESPANKVLRSVEPWSSYLVLPIFALANAGVAWSAGILSGHGLLIMAIVLGLVVGKPAGIVGGAWLAVRFGLATKPSTYSWRQLLGAGALGGIGFTMSLFIAGQAFPDASNFAAAKIAIFIASILAGTAGVLLLWHRRVAPAAAAHAPSEPEVGTAIPEAALSGVE
jgi:NhaA family Na+:H+ antiporter